MKHFRFTFTITTLLMMASVFIGCNPITNTPEPTGIVLKNNCTIAEDAKYENEDNALYEKSISNASIVITGVDIYEASKKIEKSYYVLSIDLKVFTEYSAANSEYTAKLERLQLKPGESLYVELPKGEYFYNIHFRFVDATENVRADFHTYVSSQLSVDNVVTLDWRPTVTGVFPATSYVKDGRTYKQDAIYFTDDFTEGFTHWDRKRLWGDLAETILLYD